VSIVHFGKSLDANVTVEDFSQLILGSGVVLIDIRTAQELNEGFIGGARHLDFYNENFANEINALNKENTYALYCRSGHRSGLAVKMMQDSGFKNICHLEGGIIEWTASGKPVQHTS